MDIDSTEAFRRARAWIAQTGDHIIGGERVPGRGVSIPVIDPASDIRDIAHIAPISFSHIVGDHLKASWVAVESVSAHCVTFSQI